MGNFINDPLSLSTEDLNNLKFKPIKIHIGENNSDIILNVLQGTIFEVGVSPGTLLPVDIKFENPKGAYKLFRIVEIKKIELL